MRKKTSLKLFDCSAVAIDYEPRQIIPALTEEEAKAKFKKSLDDDDIWYTGTVFVSELEFKDYDIVLYDKRLDRNDI